jgi:hypothetical protein
LRLGQIGAVRRIVLLGGSRRPCACLLNGKGHGGYSMLCDGCPALANAPPRSVYGSRDPQY